MFRYSPTPTAFHRLDPRVKLFLQGAFAFASFTATDPVGTAVLAALAAGTLRGATVSVVRFLREVRLVMVVLAIAPLIGAVHLRPPGIDPAGAVEPGLASVRVLALLAIGLVYVRSTPIRSSQAAVQWAVPGKPGRLLGLGVGLTFRFLPVLRDELRTTRTAMAVRGSAAVPVHRRIQLLVIVGIERAVGRTDRLTKALLARCLAWNPTLPALAVTRADVPAVLVGLALLGWALTAAIPG